MPETNFPKQLADSNWDQDLNVLGKKMVYRYGAKHLNRQSKMLEIGAFADERMNVPASESYWDMEYHVMNLEGIHHPRFIKADITNCPEIPDNSFDYIYTQDTFEHINKPWLAAKEMSRILKPRGIIYVITLFAWRYHKAPEDYFRYTPFGLCSLFDGMLIHHEANFDGKNRRGLNGIGTQGDGTANDKVPEDMLGAWRENWRVYYLGQKPW